MEDHDQRFKTLLREFFAEFFQLFFPDWADLFDFGSIEWLEKEAFPDPPTGKRRTLDLVAKLPLRRPLTASGTERPGFLLTLIHVESNRPTRWLPSGSGCSARMRIFATGTSCRCCRSAYICAWGSKG
jgi:hypothetical protein